MKRIFHPHTRWEEVPAGLWKKRPAFEEEGLLKKAIAFTGDAALYGSWMTKVTQEWKFSCEHNLTDSSLNRKAWLGHAACCMALGCPEHVTRSAWWHLSQQQQDEANMQAESAILAWEKKQEQINKGHETICLENQLELTFYPQPERELN